MMARRKHLLTVIAATWLAFLGYVVYQQATVWQLHHRQDLDQLQQQQQHQHLLTTTFKPPEWPAVDQSATAKEASLLDSNTYIQLLTAATSRRGDYFDPPVNATELRLMLALMWQVDDFCRQHNIVYFMYAATLIGSVRHHGFVPWDDDIDIMVPKSQRDRFIYLLRTRAPHLTMYTWSYQWKIWSSSGTTWMHRNYGWPFVDIFFYAENETHIFDINPSYTQRYTFEKSLTFPLHYRPFMGRWLPAPRDTAQFLVRTVNDPDGCHSPYWKHKQERSPHKSVSTRCDMLKGRYPFAKKSLPPGVAAAAAAAAAGSGECGIVESLYFEDVPLHSVLVQEPRSSITFNYSLRLINSNGVKYAEPYS